MRPVRRTAALACVLALAVCACAARGARADGDPASDMLVVQNVFLPYHVGPLLIVMPSGYGIYDGGRSTAAESRVLDGLAVPGSKQPDALTDVAANAVDDLLRAGALRSPDILKPYVQALLARPAAGRLTVQY
jgi:hypothetical protein